MQTPDKKKVSVKQMPDEDKTKYIDYSQPLNFKQLLKVIKKSEKGKPIKWAVAKKKIMAWK